MPKIEVNEEAFYALAGCPGGGRWKTREEFEAALVCAKAELDEDSDKSLPAQDRVLKIELNDTNRPDLWGTAGCARQLRMYYGGEIPQYPFFSRRGDVKKAAHRVDVQASVQGVRPFLAGFIATGKVITDPLLRDMIQTQEKLSWSFGRKRRTISMGIYRTSLIKWPIVYKGVDPDSVSFVPLQWDAPLSLREILKQHPKGKEFAFIQEHEPVHPLLTDSQGFILSYPPVINSNDIGAVQVGDSEIFIELTGTDIATLTFAASVVACDMADNGFEIQPVEVAYDFDTPFGRNVVTPYYFQEPVFCSLSRVERFLGERLSADECRQALARMGVRSEKAVMLEKGQAGSAGEGLLAEPPEYRNDFLHAIDVAEDIMIGRSLDSFKPQRPGDFTVGRLSPITLFSRRVKEIFVGMGYQEMIYNYLGSRKDLIENMRGDAGKIIRISNPMTENYEYVRDSVLASLMSSEAVSGHSVYPHKIFEVGKVAYRDASENYGSVTRQYVGFLHAGSDANFNTAASQLQTMFYYLSRQYAVEESDDPRFIPGRAAAVLYNGRKIGVFGEIHPQALENWGIAVPCTAGELDLDSLIEAESPGKAV
ncbi:MAG: phenylalanine--tRNA ligase subunit beta [Spirochaetes bacterium]|nr:phenylalanine--tRNA ligase subunit beta [Spirochaetota bacterium]